MSACFSDSEDDEAAPASGQQYFFGAEQQEHRQQLAAHAMAEAERTAAVLSELERSSFATPEALEAARAAAAAAAASASDLVARTSGSTAGSTAGSSSGAHPSLHTSHAAQQAALAAAAARTTYHGGYEQSTSASTGGAPGAPPGAGAGMPNAEIMQSVLYGAQQSSEAQQSAPGLAHVSQMGDYNAMHMGAGIISRPPIFHVNSVLDGNGGWVDWAGSGIGDLGVLPVRSLCLNIPAECFAPDARRLTHWQTPAADPTRAVAIAALLGLLWTGTLKGWLSGDHEEVARATGEAGTAREGGKPRKLPSRVSRYQFVSRDNPNDTCPMWTACYEELFDSAKSKVIGIRIWKHVWDASHSDSALVKHLVDESHRIFCASGAAHEAADRRKQTLVSEHARMLALIGGSSLADAKLEHGAAMQYARVTSEAVLMQLLPLYSGASDASEGRPVVKEMNFPPGTLNNRIEGAPATSGLGGTSPLSPEYLFCAKREHGLRAGLVNLDGELMDVHPDQLDPLSYFDPQTQEMRLPTWLQDKQGYSFQTDPSKLSVFEMPMPRPIAGVVTPGPALLTLFRDRFAPGTDVNDPQLLDLFSNCMTGADQSVERTVAMFAESITTFDTAGCSNEQRVAMNRAKSLLRGKGGVRSYGGGDDGSFIIEPRQALKDIALDTSQIYSRVVVPWIKEERNLLRDEEVKLRAYSADGAFGMESINHKHFEALRKRKQAFDAQHAEVVKDVAHMHLRRIERSFRSRVDADSIPAGYRAAWDGLQTELEAMPNHSANIAFGLDIQKTDSDRSVFGLMINWLGCYFEDECFIDGRDWRIMQELFFHCFEQWHDNTLLLILCGPKGNGKSLRTERLQAVFPEGWIKQSGPGSNKAGMQGNNDSNNGCNLVYDEMIDELVDGQGGNRIEYWKTILLKREYVYNKVVTVKGSDGVETNRTFKLMNHHLETHIACTNFGPAFTKGDEVPSEVKTALIDRSIPLFVRTLGAKPRLDAEFKAHHTNPEVKRKTSALRTLVSLMGITLMAIRKIPFFQPDLALAQKMWDQWDEGPNGLEKAYCLPKPSPRKNVKRLQNCITMTVLNAVAEVFFFKQSAVNYDCSQLDEDGNPKPFDVTMIFEVIKRLQPTPEIIHHAWSMGLEYNVGTSAMGVNGLTVLADLWGLSLEQLMRQVPADVDTYVLTDSEVLALTPHNVGDGGGTGAADADNDDAPPPDKDKDGKKGGLRQTSLYEQHGKQHASRPGAMLCPEFDQLMKGDDPGGVSDDKIQTMIKYFRKNRLSRSMYKYKCSRTELSNQALSDAEKLADEAISSELRRDNSMDLDSVSDARDVVDPLGSPCAPMEGVTPTQPCTSAAAVAEALRAQAAAEQAAEQAAKQAAEQAAQAAEQAAEQPAQPAAPTGTSAGTSGPPAVAKRPFYSRAFGNLAPSLVQASIFYQPSVLVQLSNGRAAPATDAAEPTVCARPNINFAKHEGSNGVTWIDTAWMCQGGGDGAPKFEGWRKLALHVLNQSKSRTVKQFDYHLDGLRDVLYLISSEDNRRRLQERPHMPSDRLLGHWLEDVENSRITESTRAVRTRPFAHPELAAALAPPGFMGPKRLPDAFVASSNLQRRFDAQLLAGRFSVMQTLLSNRILVSPPVRLVNDQVHFSTSAAHDHLHLVAEAAVACSKIPGLKNMQETFCHDQKGPPGLSVRRSNANDGDVTSQQSEDSRAPSRTGSEAGNGPVSRGARGKDDIFDSAAKHHTLPYSYDLVQIFLSLQMADMLYDDISESHLERANKQYGSALDVKLTTEDIPQLTLRYPGYSERNRQTISIPLRRKRARMYSFVEAADPTTGEAHISIDHVTRSISRPATHDDLVQYVSRRQGSRSMKGVSGDLFASSTWLHHTIATLSDRGLVGSGTDLDSSKLLFANMLTCLTSRAIELASAKGLAGYGALKIAPSQPRTYAALAKRELLAAEQRAVRDADGLFGAPGMQMRTSINDCMLDATEIAYPALPGLAPPSPAPSASRIPRPVDAGSSGAGPSGYGGTSVIDGDEELHMSRPVDMTAEILSQPHL